MNKIDLTGINNFVSKLNKTKKSYDSKKYNNVKSKIEKMALEEIEKSYAVIGLKPSKVDIDDNNFKIVIKHQGIGFDEFGTGFYAKGTYEGDLPKQTLVFKSAKKTRKTNGWEYWYSNDDTKRIRNGKFGWYIPPRQGFPKGTFHIGTVASNRFYRGCRRIRERIRTAKW